MKVALLAPNITPDHGGVWQFVQWIATRIGPEIPMHVIAREAALAELALHRPAGGSAVSTMAAERLFAPMGVLPGVPGRAVRRLADVRVPLFGKLGKPFESRLIARDLATSAIDVLHVPSQRLEYAALAAHHPYVINPHDYQHEHFPQYFRWSELKSRRYAWYRSQRGAAAIVVHSLQTREDALRFLGVPEERVFYAPYGPLPTFAPVDDATARDALAPFELPESFVFYPARMWRHKNHEALLEALYLLKTRRGLSIGCVLTDAGGPDGDRIRSLIAERGLEKQVAIVGRVTPLQMSALYKQCSMVVIPSLFEQNSGPMLEALQLGKAVAVADLPELVRSLGNGGLVFDARSVTEVADAIDHGFSSADALAKLEMRARQRASEMSWTPFIETYRAAYEYAAARG